MTRPMFLMAALVLLAAWLPLVAVVVREEAIHGAVAVQVAGALTTVILVCLTVGLDQSAFASLALVAAVCSLVGGLIFARFLDHRP